MKITPKQGVWVRKDPDNAILTLSEMKSFCYVETDMTDDDALFTRMELAARNICEKFLGRPLLTATQELYYNRSDILFHCSYSSTTPINLPSGKLQSIDGVTTIDADGNESVLDAATYYEASTVGEQGQIFFKQSPFSSTNTKELDALRIDITAGFGDTTESVPQELKQGMEFLISNWYEHREDQQIGNTITSSAKASWSPWKMQRFKV